MTFRVPASPASADKLVQGVSLRKVDETGEGVRLDRFLKREFPGLTQGQIEKWLRSGEIRVDGGRAKSSDRLKAGQELRLPPLKAAIFAPRPGPEAGPRLSQAEINLIRDAVIYEDADLIAFNKPHGLAVQGGTKTLRHVDGLLAAFDNGEGKPKLVHRLDRDTSGVLVVAKTAHSAAWITQAFRTRGVDKIYWAVTIGAPHPLDGEIRGFMKKAAGPVDGDREMMVTAAHGDPDGRFAITDYTVIAHASGKAAWVAMRPVTGRTHQLRFHMALIGSPIVGDPKYGHHASRGEHLREAPGGLAPLLHLHARGLELRRPDGRKLRFIAPLSPHMAHAFELLGFETGDAKNPFAALARE